MMIGRPGFQLEMGPTGRLRLPARIYTMRWLSWPTDMCRRCSYLSNHYPDTQSLFATRNAAERPRNAAERARNAAERR